MLTCFLAISAACSDIDMRANADFPLLGAPQPLQFDRLTINGERIVAAVVNAFTPLGGQLQPQRSRPIKKRI
jgi:hypothetical protein